MSKYAQAIYDLPEITTPEPSSALDKLHNKLWLEVDGFNGELVNISKGNKAACRRARKHLLVIRELCGTARKELSNIVNGE